MSEPKLVVIGGGTGSFTLLQELKNWTKNITAIVNMSDDGGSSGELRDELGVLPPGDIRQCLVALSNNPDTRDMFSYRFGNGKFDGHPVGNIILSALELQTGSFTKAVKIVADFMRITGKVVPVSTENHTLIMDDGEEVIEGEYRVSQHKIKHPDAKISLKPKAALNPEAKEAIQQADLVVIAPGNLYGSLLPALAVDGMAEALQATKAKVIMVANLVNKPNQTLGWHVVDYVKQMSRYIGTDTIDLVLYNNELPDKSLLDKYAEDEEFPLDIDPAKFRETNLKAVGARLIASEVYKPDSNDKTIRRTLIRHDAKKVSDCLKEVLSTSKSIHRL